MKSIHITKMDNELDAHWFVVDVFVDGVRVDQIKCNQITMDVEL